MGRGHRPCAPGSLSAEPLCRTGLDDNDVLYGSKLENRAIVNNVRSASKSGSCPDSFAEQVLGARKRQSRSSRQRP